jgi:LPS export ABC transporter protein LptC
MPGPRRSRLRVRAGLLVLALGLTCGCAQEPPSIRLAANGQEPTLLFEGFHMISTQGGEREWDFYARAAQIYERQNLARAQDIKVVYWRGGKEVSSLTARRGFLQTETRYIRAEKDVVMVSAQGDVLRTEMLQWDNARGIITTDQPVTVERGSNVLTGVGLRADSDLKNVEVLAQVKIRVRSMKTLATPGTGRAPASR